MLPLMNRPMTDEEKAEEYAKGKAREHYNFLFEEHNDGSPAAFAKLCYLDGIAEGRKELEKENEELKAALNNHPETASVTQLMELIQLREENKRLTKELEEMKAQNEKGGCNE